MPRASTNCLGAQQSTGTAPLGHAAQHQGAGCSNACVLRQVTAGASLEIRVYF